MPVKATLRVIAALSTFSDRVGRWGSLLIIPLVLVTAWDIFARKLVWIQLWLIDNVGSIFRSTILQEMEWHIHTGLFALVLGMGYVNNRHVRVDLLHERLTFRSRAWVEFLGCTLFLLPFCLLVIYFAFIYVYESFVIGEISASLVGLSHRWLIKSVLLIGLIVALLAGIAVWLETILVLFGPRELRFEMMTLKRSEPPASTAGDEAHDRAAD